MKQIIFVSITPDLYACSINGQVYDRVTVEKISPAKGECIIVRTRKEHALAKLN